MILLALQMLAAPDVWMIPKGEIGDWSAILRPPYEVIDMDRLRYIPDLVDHHQRPAETALRGGGDCEDWVVADYHDRKAEGEDGLYLVVGVDRGGDIHAVLLADGVYHDRLDMMTAEFQALFYIDETQAYAVVGR